MQFSEVPAQKTDVRAFVRALVQHDSRLQHSSLLVQIRLSSEEDRSWCLPTVPELLCFYFRK
jgi:hypothetical protein